ncbi:MAG: hypothetical protein GXP51_10135, partial [Deltaproteobacteria bacterium]|nr:hypothetical protein [Deltaproteobacteria bacterium]
GFKDSVERRPITTAGLPYDPFAEDFLGLDIDSVSGIGLITDSVDTQVHSLANHDTEDTAAVAESDPGTGTEVSLAMIDPFAEDEDFTV